MAAGGDLGEQVGNDLHLETDGLPMHEKVSRSFFQDRMMRGHKHMKEALHRELNSSASMGVPGEVPALQPLLLDKMNRSLASISDLADAHGKDQRRSMGFAEVKLGMLRNEGIQTMCSMGDDSTFAFASAEGPLWVYNWREGSLVCTLRDDQDGSGAVHSMCPASLDHSMLATGDEQGFFNIWSVPAQAKTSQAKLHMDAIIGMCCARELGWVATASVDSYMCLFDMAKEQVIDRAMMWSSETCTGTRTSALCLSEESQKLILVGAEDGHVHCWYRDGGRLREQGTLECVARPSKILALPDGHSIVVGTTPLNPVASQETASPADGSLGGLLLFDLRKVGKHGESALVSTFSSTGTCKDGGSLHDGFRRRIPRTGVTDMALLQDGALLQAVSGDAERPMSPATSRGMSVVDSGSPRSVRRGSFVRRRSQPHIEASDDNKPGIWCLMDGVVRAFTVGSGGLRHHLDFDVTPGVPSSNSVLPLNICSAAGVLVTTTTSPSVEFWRRRSPSEHFGHSDSQNPLQPLALEARCLPIHHSQLPEGPHTQLHAPKHLKPVPGATLAMLQASLEADARRVGSN
mmetsp:Transcript_25570/g.59527  ORF Transcript_25570/g.59527 Transcript_25570/m.59527 type:complete len:576 (+) Transcript_25570:93-1820(+)